MTDERLMSLAENKYTTQFRSREWKETNE